MSACPLFDRITMINTSPPSATEYVGKRLPMTSNGVGQPQQNGLAPMSPPGNNKEAAAASAELVPGSLEKDYYGCYCLKFIVKNGTHITEDKVLEDFGQFGEVVDIRGPGLFSGLRGNHVYVRFIEKVDAEEALRHLSVKYHQLTPASISDVLPDNYGLYTISFYNKTGIPSSEVRREFSNFGEVKNLTGSLDVKGGRVFVSYKEKSSAVQALQAFFFRKEKYPNMKFALPRCEKDYFGCYCLKFYNKSGDITEDKVLKDFGQFGDVVDVRGPGLFDVTGDDVYVRYKEKSSAEQALVELVGKYDSLCLAPPSDIQADKFGYFTITFVNDKCLSKSDVWYIFSKFGTVACVNGTFDCKKGRVFVSYKDKQGALNALETMLITKEYHLQVSKNSTVRKNDYNVVASVKESIENSDYSSDLLASKEAGSSASNSVSTTQNHQKNNGILNGHGGSGGHEVSGNQADYPFSTASNVVSPNMRQAPPSQQQQPHSNRDHSRSREPSLVPVQQPLQQPSAAGQPVAAQAQQALQPPMMTSVASGGVLQQPPPNNFPQNMMPKNGLVKFNRNVEKDIFGYFCLSFLNEDGDINEKKVRHDFGKFGEVVSVRGALGKQKGHVFVRFRRKEAAENCLNCLNSFPLSEMSELFGKYLYLSPATPRDIDCDMYGLYSISFLNLNLKSFREIRQEFSKFGEIVRLTSGGSGNTDELVSISYSDKSAAIKALQTHFTNKEFPYLDIAKGSSLLLVNSSDSSDNEENEADYIGLRGHYNNEAGTIGMPVRAGQHAFAPGLNQQPSAGGNAQSRKDPFHDPAPRGQAMGSSSDVVDELLKPFQSYFSIYRTGQYHNNPILAENNPINDFASNGNPINPMQKLQMQQQQQQQQQRSPDKKYRIKNVPKNGGGPGPSNGPAAQPQHSPAGPSVPNGPNGPMAASNSPMHYKHQVQQQQQPLEPVSNGPPPPPVQNIPNGLGEVNEVTVAPASAQPNVANEVSQAAETSSTSANPEEVLREVGPLEPDMFGLYSLSFYNKTKDLSERKIRADFCKYGEVAKIRGCSANSLDSPIIVSFNEKGHAEKAVHCPALLAKYGPSLNTCPGIEVVPDPKDGYYSVEFVNSGMNGIREITNEFSKFGEITKISSGKRVTISFADKQAAFAALKAHETSKDYVSIDFSKECLRS